MYFGDLGWRSNGSLGHGRHWTFDNDTGPDDANHDRDGICIITGPEVAAMTWLARVISHDPLVDRAEFITGRAVHLVVVLTL